MKTINLLTAALILQVISLFSQTDSIIYLKETDFSILKSHMVTFQSTGEKEQMTESTDLEDVKVLTFLQNDSLVLTSETGSPVYTRLGDIQEVNKYKKRFSLVLGIALGAAGGGILGLVIGGSIYRYEPKSDENIFDPLGEAASRNAGTIVGALIGAIGGGVLGAVITEAVNRASLDLFSVPDKDKKLRLIKFLRKNK